MPTARQIQRTTAFMAKIALLLGTGEVNAALTGNHLLEQHTSAMNRIIGVNIRRPNGWNDEHSRFDTCRPVISDLLSALQNGSNPCGMTASNRTTTPESFPIEEAVLHKAERSIRPTRMLYQHVSF